MKNVILKALSKASVRGLDANATADLILDYLEIAGDLPGLPPPLPLVTNYHIKYGEGVQTISTSTALTAPPRLNQVLVKPSEEVPANGEFWDQATLMEVLGKKEWAFTAQPAGWKQEIAFRGKLAPEIKGMRGVAVVFKRSDEPSREEFPIFFPYADKSIDPDAQVADLKKTIEQLFRISKVKIEPNTPAPQGFPGMLDQNNSAFGATVIDGPVMGPEGGLVANFVR